MAQKSGTGKKVLLTALIALAIFLVPASSALSVSPSVSCSDPPAEGSLSAPRAQAWTYTIAIPEFVAGLCAAVASAILTFIVDGGGAAIAAIGTILAFFANCCGAVCVLIGSLPFAWMGFWTACSDALPMFVWTMCAFLISTLVGAMPSFLCFQTNLPARIGPAIAELCTYGESECLWCIEGFTAFLAAVLWEIPYLSFFCIAAVLYLFLAWGIGVLTWIGDAIIIIANSCYAALLGCYETAAGWSGALFCYSDLVSLGPLNLIIALMCGFFGIFFFIFCGIPALVVGFFGGLCALCTSVVSKFFIYCIAPLADLGAGCGGMFILTGPIDLSTASFGLFQLCIPGILLTLTVIGAPLGVPMAFFGTVLCCLFGIYGALETLWTWFWQAPCIYYIPDICVIILIILFDYGDLVAEIIVTVFSSGILIFIALLLIVWWFFSLFLEILAYILDWLIGWCNAAVWALWVGLTALLCAMALGPWSCALASCLASIPSDAGLVLDMCSWTFLNVQDQILWLWQLFFQSFAD